MNMDPMHRPERVSSRLIKKERSKLLKQTIWIIGGGIVLVLGFLFFVLPNFIKIINSVLNTNPIPEEESILLQAPVLVAPVPATYSAQLVIQGVGQSNIKTIFIVNGTPGPETMTAEDGSFSGTIDLTEGENSVVAYGVDEKGNESPTSREYKIMVDMQAPLLELNEPQENQEFDNKHKIVTVSGKTEAGVKLYLNDRFFLPKADGSFSTTFSLADGENKLKLRGIDEAGNQSQLERTVKFNP